MPHLLYLGKITWVLEARLPSAGTWHVGDAIDAGRVDGTRSPQYTASRSSEPPQVSLGLLQLPTHLAMNLGVINATSYELAAHDFIQLCPWYRPNRGIQRFLSENWGALSAGR